MSDLKLEISLDNVLNDLEDLKPRIQQEGQRCLDDMAEIYRESMIHAAPYKWGDLRAGHIIKKAGDTRYIYSDVPHFAPLVKGHKVFGPIFSDLQRRWWFWHLNNELGGSYQPQTNGKTLPSKYVDKAFESAQNRIERRLDQFLDKILK